MAEADYKLKIWGARGTVPTPNPAKLRFGGHTACLAARVGEADWIVLDAGSGLRRLGNELARCQVAGGSRIHIFLSHYHLDHIEGIPYFQPLYDPAAHVTFHGFDPDGSSVRQALEGYMAPPYFPVRLDSVPAKVDYRTAGAPVPVGDVTVSCLPLTHPNGSYSYRLERAGRRIVLATDHEHGDPATDRALVRFAEGADYLIYDATYIPTEYESLRKGWGHSTWYAAVQTAMMARVKTLVLFHHHPDYTDDELERVCEVAREEFPATEIASEGMELPF